MSYTIGSILEKRTNKNRVEYFINWSGYSEEENTWERRMDLIKDGHADAIQLYEAIRKDRMRSTSRSRQRIERLSKTPTGARKKDTEGDKDVSVDDEAEDAEDNVQEEDMSVRQSRRGKADTFVRNSRRSGTPPQNVLSTHKEKSKNEQPSVLPVVQLSAPGLTSSDEEDEDAEDETDDSVESSDEQLPSNTCGRENNVVSAMIGDVMTKEWMIRFFMFLFLAFTILANVIIPEILKSPALSKLDNMDFVLKALNYSNALPALICFLLVIRTKDCRLYASLVAIASLWRTSGEVMLLLSDANGVYASAALAMFFVADFSAFSSMLCLINNDRLSKFFGLFGGLGMFASDVILVFFKQSQVFPYRVLILSLSLTLLTVATLNLENDNLSVQVEEKKKSA